MRGGAERLNSRPHRMAHIMATSMQDYSPINSLQKMVDTIPVNNVNSSGSEKKSTKNIRRKKIWRRRHLHQPLFCSYRRLLTSNLTNC